MEKPAFYYAAFGKKGGKLADDDVRAIRSLRRDGVPIAEVAARFKVSKGTISRITGGEMYAHVT